MKQVKIEKKYLNNLPEKVEEKPKIPADVAVNARIDELEQRLERAEATIEFLAQFEATLLKAVKAEIDMLFDAAPITKNEYQKSVFNNLASSLRRIEERWTDGVDFKIDASKMKVIRVNKE